MPEISVKYDLSKQYMIMKLSCYIVSLHMKMDSSPVTILQNQTYFTVFMRNLLVRCTNRLKILYLKTICCSLVIMRYETKGTMQFGRQKTWLENSTILISH